MNNTKQKSALLRERIFVLMKTSGLLKLSNLLQNSPLDCFSQITDLEQLIGGSSPYNNKRPTGVGPFVIGGEGGSRTHAPFNRPNAFRVHPLGPLEYFSVW